MINGKNDIEQIEKYVTLQLTGKELEDFEQKISQDPALAQEVEGFKQAMKGIEHYDLKLQLKGYHEELLKEASSSGTNWRYATSIAATVVLAIAATYLFYFQAPSHESLFAKHFVPYEDITSVRALASDNFKKGMKFYVHGKYQDAITTLSTIPQSSNRTDETKFYLGISHLALNEPKAAGEYFLMLSNSLFSEQVKWYLGLSYLRDGKHSLAFAEFSTIAKGEFNYEGARKILSEMDNDF